MVRPKVIRFIISFTIFVLISASKYQAASEKDGEFRCLVDDAPYTKSNLVATMQTITGGHTQVSLSHKPFTSFFFNNPEAGMRIDVGEENNRKAVIHYQKSRSHRYSPIDGYVKITAFNKAEKFISGRFQMTLVRDDKKKDSIEITNGSFTKIPVKDQRP